MGSFLKNQSSLPTPPRYSVLPLLAVSYLQEGGQSAVVPNGLGQGEGAAFQSVHRPLGKCVPAPDDGELGPLDGSAGHGARPVRDRTRPQSSLN